MSITHTRTLAMSVNSNPLVSGQSSQTGDEDFVLSAAVPASTTNGEYDVGFTQAAVKSVVLFSDQAITIKTNSSSTPQDTISLAAGVPLIWQFGDSATIPFAGNVTKMFITNANLVAANVTAHVLVQQ